MAKITHEEMFRRALLRPKNYLDLTSRRQWEIDGDLGILDWAGPQTEEEWKAIIEHHDLEYQGTKIK